MPSDPWRFQRWAFETVTGNPIRKAVLSMLAMMADCNTGRCEAKQDTLAAGVEATKATIAGHLKALEDQGLIARRMQRRRDGGRRGDEFLLLAPGVSEWPDGDPVDPTPRLTPPPPETDGGPSPSNMGAGTTKGNGHASKQEDPRERVPDDFPDELRPHARIVMGILKQVAEDHNAKKVWPKAVALVVMGHPHHPLVRTAQALETWAVDPARPIKDVVATYRRFLEGASELATIEPLRGDAPTATARRTKEDERKARAAADMEAIERVMRKAQDGSA